MIHFGFSYIGLLYLLMMFIPNIIWTRQQPKDYEKYVQKENILLQIFEKAGEVLVCCIVLIFSDFNIRTASLWSLWLFASFVLMIFYEWYWLRYFRSQKTMYDFYKPLLGVPVPGASLPVVAFILLGVYGSNVFLIIVSIILGIGHIGIHIGHYRTLVTRKKKNIFIKIIRWILVTLSLFILGAIMFIIGLRNFNYLTNYIDREIGVDEGIYVPLGGQEQYLLIRGKDVTNPVIIWLHGGPASPDSMNTYTFTNYLIDDYTVVCWDQRGCGRTYFKNIDVDHYNKTATFEQAQEDLDQLVEYISERFGTEEVILVGHSYGTMVGSKYALENPEKISHYIGVGQVASIESDIYSYEDALAQAKENGDDTSAMITAYNRLLSEKSIVNLMNLRSYVSPYHTAEKEVNALLLALGSPYLGVDDARWFLKLGDLSDYVNLNQQLFDYTLEINVYNYGTDYLMPVGFISGSCDWVTPVKYSEEYFNTIKAPKKEMKLINGCGHSPQDVSPEEFCDALKTMIQ